MGTIQYYKLLKNSSVHQPGKNGKEFLFFPNFSLLCFENLEEPFGQSDLGNSSGGQI